MLSLPALILSTSFLAQCGPAVAPSTTRAIIQVESGGNPYAIGDNSLRRSFAPRSKSQAVSLASLLLARGHNIDVGLMQINSAHLASMHLSLDELFHPCSNIRAGTAILAEFYRKNQTADPAVSLFKALSAYNTGRAWRGPGYVNKVLQAAGVPYRVSLRSLPAGAAAKSGVVLMEAESAAAAKSPSVLRPYSRQLQADSASSSLFFSGGPGLVFPVQGPD